ncbi:MAG: antitoxin PrlF [Lentimonas sp.]|jgi:antitoxin PrlF
MATATITSKHQITIPKAVRQKLNLREGDQLEFNESDSNKVVLMKSRRLNKSDGAAKQFINSNKVLTAYGLNKDQILTAIEAVADDTRFHIEHAHLLVEAIKRARKKGDLPEHIAALTGKAQGVSKPQTFDKAVKGFSEFEVL